MTPRSPWFSFWPRRAAEPCRPIPHVVLVSCCVLAAWLSLLHPGAVDAAPGPVRTLPAGAVAGDGGPSPAIYPPQVIPLRFSHQQHVQKLGISCVDCHQSATQSTESRDRLLPPATRCDGCHGTDHRDILRVGFAPGDAPGAPKADCAYCHVNAAGDVLSGISRVVLPAPNLKFNHRVHAEKKIGCQRCHGGVEQVGLATRDQLPRMSGCLDCHRGSSSSKPGATPSGACGTCHLTEGGGRLKTRFASGLLSPPRWLRNAEHGADWIERHKSVAGNDSRFCANCHKERECVDCHDGRVRPRSVHPNDFLSMHAVAAQKNGSSCGSCHRQQSFCSGCHQRSGVAQSGPFQNFAGRGRFHPPKASWMDGPRGSNHHAWQAQRNLNACTSCHTERDCATCHATRRVGGPGGGVSSGFSQGVDPHPPGFRSRCGAPFRRNPRACIFCHGRADPALSACR